LTPTEAEVLAAREAAGRALAAGMADEPRAEEAELRPLPIQSPEREPAGWLVGVLVGERLAGFVQLDSGLGFRRYASFAGEGPLARDWPDPETVLARATAALAPGESVEDLYLGYDKSPDRIAWVVRVAGPQGEARTLLVTGDEVSQRKENE
jgi:hypothetical protein